MYAATRHRIGANCDGVRLVYGPSRTVCRTIGCFLPFCWPAAGERRWTSTAYEMAPKVGLEPIEASLFVFPSLLIIAFLCGNLYALIRAFPSYSKDYFASLGNNRQKKLCVNVRLCGNCAAVEFCAGTVRALVATATSANAPWRAIMRDWSGLWRVWLWVAVATAMIWSA